MKAIRVAESDHSLEWSDAPTPTPGPGEVLVKTLAAGVNRADLLQAAGHYPPPPGITDILGLEAVGEVVEFGPGAGPTPLLPTLAPGDTVAALLAGGAYAEYFVCPATHLLPLPAGWSITDTASIIESATTVWSNLGMVAGLAHRQEPHILIHGGTGGIGTFAVQLARHFTPHVATTVGSADGAKAAEKLGATTVINYREQAFDEILRGSVDIILDIMGAKYLSSNIRALGEKGHLVIIGMQGGVKGELNINSLLVKRASITATALRSRSIEDKADVVASTYTHVWPLLESGEITPQVAKVVPIAQAQAAHEFLAARTAPGKVVLEF